MKLSKSKLALAKVINENGGWPSDEANFAAQDKIDGESNDNTISFYSGKVKPTRLANNSMWRCENSGSHFMGYEKTIRRCKLLPNWHQTCLSREEYYQAYPVSDADGWIEWNGGECPVEPSTKIGVRYRNGGDFHSIITAASQRWSNNGWPADIIAYRLHKPEVKPEFCESVMRSIPEPESIDGLCAKVTEENKHQHVDAKPTIEQLAQDYRNKLDFAKRKQQESDDARVAADAALVELERAGEALGLLIGTAKPDREPELVITDWRDLRVGDVIRCIGDWQGEDTHGVELSVDDVECPGYGGRLPIRVILGNGDGAWGSDFEFIRRP